MHVRVDVRGLLALSAVALLASGLVHGSVASPSAGAPAQVEATTSHRPPTPPTLDWADCGDGFECAVI